MDYTYTGPNVDMGDFLIPHSHQAKFSEPCSCTNPEHRNHPEGGCTQVVERDCVRSKKGYTCFDCNREKTRIRDKARAELRKQRNKENRGKKPAPLYKTERADELQEIQKLRSNHT